MTKSQTEKKKSKLQSIWDGFISVLSQPKIVELITIFIVKLLRLNPLLRSNIAMYFAVEAVEEVIEVIDGVGDHIITKKEIKDTADEEDRDNTADRLNDLLR